MKGREKNKSYTFMIVPHDAAGRSLQLRIPSNLAHGIFFIIIAFVAVFSLSVVYSTFLSGKLIHYKTVVMTSAEKDRNLEQFASETETIKQELQNLLDQNNSLRKQLGLRVEKTSIDLKAKEPDNKQFDLSNLQPKVKRVSLDLKSSLDEIEKTKTSYKELQGRVEYLQKRLAVTPTAWPIYGPIMSYFGYRRSPWRSFHTGVDIGAPYGAPVRATAAGTVTFTGWRTGFGRAVAINHGFGLSSFYAHNSRFAVTEGQHVRKGQVIAYIGTSGYSTGPHCHYEVHRNGVAVNPMPYLGMSILTAGRCL
ncbi:MAG TPA: peptidoglycan DD-metalloendopeptidase family protein [Candidatus Omnitrophota bacterium]|nr:peptidoglycan DD-metalloendopeptidase family protein [Candidatus Omnitrophota bacterium]